MSSHSPSVFYKPTGKEIEIFESCFKNKLPLLLKGPTGAGKTRFIEYMASKLQLELITVSCHEETSAVDLLGRHLIKGAETIWQDGPLTRAVRNGAILYLDEIAEARPDVIVAIHPLTDHRRELFLDRLNETIYAKDSFMLIASFNPGYQRGWKELKPSTRQRFVSIQFSYPSFDLEKEILQKESGIEDSIAKRLVQIAHRIRASYDLSLSETVSTRLLVDAAKLIASGISPRMACEVAIAQPLSDDPDTIFALRDMISLVF
ncbi:MAG: CbbQ/NirQ/NorQ/GpvN family protein [Leptospiraceae bacterium]|nr:CbbQ/NirQ/NorQ/GpvN family protein [Leptospiraceae bacterium]MCP5498596.1 CbbQ/NirQ/NorQ/GpvN family protein [Leptospiraceae bacterium]